MDRSHRILVVDDDALERASLTAVLAEEGILATCCERAVDALEHLRACPDFGLIISDVMMPEMDGLEFARHVRGVRPGIPLMFITGHDDVVDRVVADGNIALLKPYTAASLKRVLRERLALPG